MNDRPDDFERELQTDLRRLADGAGPGPGGRGVRRALRRRAVRRLTGAAGGLACLSIVLFLGWPRAISRRPLPLVPPVAQVVPSPAAPESAMAAGPAIEPLDPGGNSRDTSSALTKYFASVGAERVVVSKRPGEGVSFAMLGSATRAPEDVAEEIDVLLQDFDSVDLVVLAGRMERLSLLAMAGRKR